jgi:flagella basal body P-ring formation protein FlgA
MIALASVAMAACLAVSASSDFITVRDLAPAFHDLDASILDNPVGLAPAPGIQRVLFVTELRRIAARMGIAGNPEHELCFERPVTPLTAPRLLAAMRTQAPGAEIEILDYSRMPVPEGVLEFPVSGLRQTPSSSFWNGWVRYANNRRYAVWAKVRVSLTAPRVVAAVDLKPGKPIDPSQLRVETREESAAAGASAAAIDQVAGRTLQRPVTAGMTLRMQWLEVPKDVVRGDTVQVDVWSGSAHLKLEAVAEGSGAIGQKIPVRNSESKKRFWGQVVAKGKVSVGKEGS